MRATILLSRREYDHIEADARIRGLDGASSRLRRKLEELGITVEVFLQVSDPETNPDLDWLFAESDRVQTEMEKIRHVGQASMDCPECGGSGSVAGGSLGSCCPSCAGGGVVDAPFAEPLQLPDMAAFRLKLQAPDAIDNIPKLRAELADIKATAKQEAQRVLAAPARATSRALPRRSSQKALGPSDEELDTLEDGES